MKWRHISKFEVTLRLTINQYILVSSTLVGLRPDITSCGYVAVWNFRSCFCGVPRVCNLQCNHSMVRVAQNPWSYFTVSSETPPTWRTRFLYLYPPETGWPSDTSGHWVMKTYEGVFMLQLFYLPRERAPGMHRIKGWVGPRAGSEDIEKWKFLTLPGLELWPLDRSARSQLLYRMHCRGSHQHLTSIKNCSN
jgi:hypothetical protein